METLWQQREAEESGNDYSATEENWKQFMSNKCWQDLRHFIQVSIDDAKEMLTYEYGERAIKETDDSLRGGIKVLRRVLTFPEDQLKELEDDSRRDDSSGIDPGE